MHGHRQHRGHIGLITRVAYLAPMTQTGIPAEAFDFYDALAVDNSKSFWDAHKDDYETFVRGPMQQIAAALEPAFGVGHLYRPYRDLRFSRDRTPYKDHQGLFVGSRNGLGWYAQVSATGLMVAGGWYSSTSEQVRRYRDAVADDEQEVLRRLLDDAHQIGLTAGGALLKTRPRGIPADHPRIDLLRYRSLYLSVAWEPQAWMGSQQVLHRIRASWEAARPAMDWLAGAVGPGEPPIGSRRQRA